MPRQNRRVFLSEFFSSGFILLSSFIVSKSNSTEKLENRLVHLFKNQESAKIIGLEYLKIVPEENNKKQLLSLFASTLGRFPALYTTTDPRELRAWLRICRHEDFKEGRIINVKNFLLSITESRICALVALQSSLSSQSLDRVLNFHL